MKFIGTEYYSEINNKNFKELKEEQTQQPIKRVKVDESIRPVKFKGGKNGYRV